jgi:hypothetical protein
MKCGGRPCSFVSNLTLVIPTLYIVEWRIGKKRSWPNRRNIQAFSWRDRGKSWQPSVGIQAGIRTEHLPSTSIVRYRSTNLLGEVKAFICLSARIKSKTAEDFSIKYGTLICEEYFFDSYKNDIVPILHWAQTEYYIYFKKLITEGI